MPRTVLRSAINRPVRYSAKCWRSGSLANRSAYWVMRSCTTVGNSTIAGIPAPGGDSVGTDRMDYRTTGARVVQLCKTTVKGDDPAGPTALGIFTTFASIVIATAAALFQRLLQNAVDIKSENDLTV